MRITVSLLTLCVSLWACGGECVTCHPKLEPLLNNTEHVVLTKCTTCHNKPLDTNGACGQDCFTCHDKNALYSDATTAEHQAIKACYECHKDSDILAKGKPSVSSSPRQKPLIELFK